MGLGGCQSGDLDVNGIYSDGCACENNLSGNTCSGSASLGSLEVGDSTTHSGKIIPGEVDWYAVSFTGGGTAQIQLAGANAGDFELSIYGSCVSAPSSPLPPDGEGWPTTVVLSVNRSSVATDCAETQYTLAMSHS